MKKWHRKSLEALASALKNYSRGEPDDLRHALADVHAALEMAMTGFLLDNNVAVPRGESLFSQLVDSFARVASSQLANSYAQLVDGAGDETEYVDAITADAYSMKHAYRLARNFAIHEHEVPSKRIVVEYLVTVPEWLSASGIDANAIQKLYAKSEPKMRPLTAEQIRVRESMDWLKRSRLARGLEEMLGRVERATFARWPSILVNVNKQHGAEPPTIEIYGGFWRERQVVFKELSAMRAAFLNRSTNPTTADVTKAWEEGVLTSIESAILYRMLDEEPGGVSSYMKALIRREDVSKEREHVTEALRRIILA